MGNYSANKCTQILQKKQPFIFQIVTGHIFQDGNKRTGLEAAILFLKLNNESLVDDLAQVTNAKGQAIPSKGDNPKKILELFTLEMATGRLNFEDCKLWFKANIDIVIVPGYGEEYIDQIS